jgi:hypothetical protein
MKYYFSFGLMLILALSCNNIKKENQKIESLINKNESFNDFFNRFSTDSVFRISRVKFPLKGFNSDETDVNSKDKPYLWSKEDWAFYAEEDFNPKSEDVKKTDTIKTDTSVIYRIYKEDSGYDIQYKFEESKNKWFLVYYSHKDF